MPGVWKRIKYGRRAFDRSRLLRLAKESEQKGESPKLLPRGSVRFGRIAARRHATAHAYASLAFDMRIIIAVPPQEYTEASCAQRVPWLQRPDAKHRDELHLRASGPTIRDPGVSGIAARTTDRP